MITTKRGFSILVVLTVALINFGAPESVAARNLSENILATAKIDNYDRVSSTIWRGAAPSDQAIRTMAQGGIQTIVDLRMDGEGAAREEREVNELGMKYVHIPMGFSQPSLAQITSFLQIVLDPLNGAVFVHCAQGADRTGTMCAIYRRLVNNWSFEDAYKEMRCHHFKPFLIGMKKSVQDFPCDSFRKMLVNQPVDSQFTITLAQKG
jgi:protein tyrosine phosphatase (PTP) superfamily phosphohydrolase (DUF442 family)